MPRKPQARKAPALKSAARKSRTAQPASSARRTTARAPKAQPLLRNARTVRERVSAQEWETRVNLAACYRLVADQGWTHLIYNHISARVPGEHDHFLINPYGFLYEEITASNLVKIDLDGNVVDDSEHTINQAGFVIHSAVHRERPDVQCVVHTHTEAGMAVSGLACGLLPLNMSALHFYNKVGYHDYEGVTLELEEQGRLVASLGENCALILRNHGLLTVGDTIAEAFVTMYQLEKACRTQLMAQTTGQELVIPPPEVCAKSNRQTWRPGNSRESNWPALLRRLDRLDPSFRD